MDGFCSEWHRGDVIRCKKRVAALAAAQAGRVSRAQLQWLGVDRGLVASWVRAAVLVPRLPRVYAFGHAAPSGEASLFEALLYAGPGAMLSHGTAAWWRGLIEYPVAAVHVCTPRSIGGLDGLVVHARSRCGRTWHRCLRATSVTDTLLGLAASEEPRLTHKALGRLDFAGALNAGALLASCGPGRAGSVALKRAITSYDPAFARTNGALAESFHGFCVDHGIPVPLVEPNVHGVTPDAYWPAHRLAVELDGYANHRSRAQLARDRRRELILRAHEIDTIRYGWVLIHGEPLAVRDDLLAQLAARA